MVTIGDLMRECRNYFERGGMDGTFTITTSGRITGAEALGAVNGQYVAIRGSAMNDGVYQIDKTGKLSQGEDIELDFAPETFSGRIWLLFPPRAFVALVQSANEIEAMNPKGGMIHESFGEYSYTKATGKDGAPMTWQQALHASLAPYKRILSQIGV